MNRELIAEARDALDGITPKPWRVGEEVDGRFAGMRTVVYWPGNDLYGPNRIVTVGQTRPHVRDNAEANVAFIAAAPELVSRLLAELAEAEVDRADIISSANSLARLYANACDERDAARAENARLRAMSTTWRDWGSDE